LPRGRGWWHGTLSGGMACLLWDGVLILDLDLKKIEWMVWIVAYSV
jgi:hypothetical protein